jgi:hypothetical protein
MSYGDSPTEFYDDICLLKFSGVAEKIGFSWPPKPWQP